MSNNTRILRFMATIKSWVVIPGFVLALFVGIQARTQAQTLVVEGGTLIDGTGAAPIKDPVIVIEGKRFKAVGAKGKVAIPPGAKIIKADRKTILPGLVDTQSGGEWGYQSQLWLHFGVTSTYYNSGCAGGGVGRGLGHHREKAVAVDKGLVPGPRMYLPIGYFDPPIEMAPPNIQAEMRGFPKDRGYAVSVSTPEEATAAVDRLAKEGGYNVAMHEGMPPELVRAFSDAAHKHGIVVEGINEYASVAADNGQDITCYMGGIVRSTVTNPANLAKLADMKANHWQQYWESPIGNYEYMMEPDKFDTLIQKLVQHHVFLVPAIAHVWWQFGTQIPHSKEWAQQVMDFNKTPGLGFVPAYQRNLWANADKPSTRMKPANAIGDQVNANHPQDMDGYAKRDDFLRRFVKAGGKLMDGGGNNGDMVPGLVTHQELEQLVYSGLTPMQAILSMTEWPAEAYHKDKDIGSVQPGRLADLIVVNGDPLVDIKNTRNVEKVIVAGKEANISFSDKYRYPILPYIRLDRSDLKFGNQKVNTISAPQTVTLTNPGTATENINHVEITKGFAQTNNCGFEGVNPFGIPPKKSCKFNITFTPTAAGAQTGKLVIFGASADLYEPAHVITMTGSGLP